MFYNEPSIGMVQGDLHKADDEDGSWITMNGARIHLNAAGVADKGPKALTDKHNAEHATTSAQHIDAAKHHTEEFKRAKGDHQKQEQHKASVWLHREAARTLDQGMQQRANQASISAHSAR